MQMAFLVTGFEFLIIGAGGIRPCNLAFGADQFNPNTESGHRGITSFFNWYYFTFTFSMIFSVTLIVYVQSNVILLLLHDCSFWSSQFWLLFGLYNGDTVFELNTNTKNPEKQFVLLKKIPSRYCPL
ncbi:hypothetical protein Dsin_007797 [Dipteronia sinensis]|uniref:Uncharacterized protein n=1 Tax=Dipteronia sinensis TaxID=43782 RepID=A0AAE0EIR8_9ROSI|nr:hypothetical protein Dsin_007797 [Dipteronia sinensis]